MLERWCLVNFPLTVPADRRAFPAGTPEPSEELPRVFLQTPVEGFIHVVEHQCDQLIPVIRALNLAGVNHVGHVRVPTHPPVRLHVTALGLVALMGSRTSAELLRWFAGAEANFGFPILHSVRQLATEGAADDDPRSSVKRTYVTSLLLQHNADAPGQGDRHFPTTPLTEAVLGRDFGAARLLRQSGGNPRLALPGGQISNQMASGAPAYLLEELERWEPPPAAPGSSAAPSFSRTQRHRTDGSPSAWPLRRRRVEPRIPESPAPTARQSGKNSLTSSART